MPPYYSVKEAVFPFIKFPGVDTILGPEMKSTGEVMGVGATFAEAFVKSQLGAGTKLPPAAGRLSACGAKIAKKWSKLPRHWPIWASSWSRHAGTANALADAGWTVTPVNKVTEGRPHIVDMIKNGEINFIVNVVEDKRAVTGFLCHPP